MFYVKNKKGKSQIDWISSRKKLWFPGYDNDATFEGIDKVETIFDVNLELI